MIKKGVRFFCFTSHLRHICNKMRCKYADLVLYRPTKRKITQVCFFLFRSRRSLGRSCNWSLRSKLANLRICFARDIAGQPCLGAACYQFFGVHVLPFSPHVKRRTEGLFFYCCAGELVRTVAVGWSETKALFFSAELAVVQSLSLSFRCEVRKKKR